MQFRNLSELTTNIRAIVVDVALVIIPEKRTLVSHHVLGLCKLYCKSDYGWSQGLSK